MEPNLDEDFWPFWIVESAGLLFPLFLLVLHLLWCVYGQRTLTDWMLLAWSAVLVTVFLFRYKAQKSGHDGLGVSFRYVARVRSDGDGDCCSI
ncbi:MAG: hypothetical protein DMG82_13015 [Acidobacteria bacterium]|nr:MAG: hypothetical protein DMG82_13015 [Acidobacteriota bacterium]